jgi:hypothetical protein
MNGLTEGWSNWTGVLLDCLYVYRIWFLVIGRTRLEENKSMKKLLNTRVLLKGIGVIGYRPVVGSGRGSYRHMDGLPLLDLLLNSG